MTFRYMMFILIFMEFALGALASKLIREENSSNINNIISISLVAVVTVIGYIINNYISKAQG